MDYEFLNIYFNVFISLVFLKLFTEMYYKRCEFNFMFENII